MKKIAFTCSEWGEFNFPGAKDNWKEYRPCRCCGSMQAATSRAGGRGLHQCSIMPFQRLLGLLSACSLRCRSADLLPRDLAACTPLHADIACVVKLALGSEEILRGALAGIPKSRRAKLLHLVTADALLTRWQRHVLDHYVRQFQHERECNPPLPGEEGKGYGSSVSSIPEMIRYLWSSITT